MDMNIDTNVDNYSLSELLSIVGITDAEINEDDITEKTNLLIGKFKQKNPKLSFFFKNVKSELLQYVQGLESDDDDDTIGEIIVTTDDASDDAYVEGFGNMENEAIHSAGDKQVTDWYENQNLTQQDKTQSDKITQRKQKIDVFGNQHSTMKRQQIATTDTFGVPVKQDSLECGHYYRLKL